MKTLIKYGLSPIGFMLAMAVSVGAPAKAAVTYCNQNYDPIVGLYLSLGGPNEDIPGQLRVHADGLASYSDASHLGGNQSWDPIIPNSSGILSADGSLVWKKAAGGGAYKIFVAHIVAFPTLYNGVSVLPTHDPVRFISTGTATLSKDCRTLTATFIDCNYPIAPTLDPNTAYCNPSNTTLVFYKQPNL